MRPTTPPRKARPRGSVATATTGMVATPKGMSKNTDKGKGKSKGMGLGTVPPRPTMQVRMRPAPSKNDAPAPSFTEAYGVGPQRAATARANRPGCPQVPGDSVGRTRRLRGWTMRHGKWFIPAHHAQLQLSWTRSLAHQRGCS